MFLTIAGKLYTVSLYADAGVGVVREHDQFSNTGRLGPDKFRSNFQ